MSTHASHGKIQGRKNAQGSQERNVAPAAGENREGLPTGEGTADKNDVADPHPATEEKYDLIPHPGGTAPPKQPDLGANSYAHDGSAPPRPHNKGSEPK